MELGDDAMRALYKASMNGCVSALERLNPLSLSRVSLSPFGETPLHIAALLGHLEFCRVLLDRKPSLASELDTEGRCPLHLASAEGHTEVVKALLLINSSMSLSRDKDDKLPLHLAAMRGRMGAIRELTRARPDSITEMIDDDGSVLHLCVRYNHLEALIFLVQLARGDQQFLAAKDKEGNTLLHLAVSRRQIKTIKYLVSLLEIRTAANALNSMGFTALDMLERCPRDFISLTIEEILIEAGAQRSANIITSQPPAPSPSIASQANIAIGQQPSSNPSITSQADIVTAQLPVPSPRITGQPDIATPKQPTPSPGRASQAEPHQSSGRKSWEYFWGKYLQYQGNWIEDTRGTLMVVATVIATMTFQSTISPPGGVWQENTKTGGYNCTTYDICEAGTAVVGYVWSEDFLKFIFFNSISFFSSLCVVLVLISGFPLKNKVIMWILTIAMTISITFMLLTYMWALGLVSPNHIYYEVYRMGYLLVSAWATILVVVGLIQTVRLVFWIKKRKKKKKNKLQISRSMSTRNGPLSANYQLE